MAKLMNTTELGAFSFLGLLASEGQVPHATAQSADTPIFAVIADEAVRGVASDLMAEGDFFALMVEAGQMRAEAPAKKYNFKIVRPTNLGGGYGGFGGGAVAAH